MSDSADTGPTQHQPDQLISQPSGYRRAGVSKEDQEIDEELTKVVFPRHIDEHVFMEPRTRRAIPRYLMKEFYGPGPSGRLSIVAEAKAQRVCRRRYPPVLLRAVVTPDVPRDHRREGTLGDGLRTG
jgi:hypothetical protein